MITSVADTAANMWLLDTPFKYFKNNRGTFPILKPETSQLQNYGQWGLPSVILVLHYYSRFIFISFSLFSFSLHLLVSVFI